MELHANTEQSIEEFAEDLFKVSEVAYVVGVFNGTRIRVELWDKGGSDLVKKYYAKKEVLKSDNRS